MYSACAVSWSLPAHDIMCSLTHRKTMIRRASIDVFPLWNMVSLDLHTQNAESSMHSYLNRSLNESMCLQSSWMGLNLVNYASHSLEFTLLNNRGLGG